MVAKLKLGAKKNKKVRKDLKTKSKPASRATATRVLAQGAGAVPRRAFGASGFLGREKISRKVRYGLNARLPMHLGLPRPVGPYQVIRTTKMHTTSAGVVIFAPLMHMPGTLDGHPTWFHACGLEDVNSTLPINATGNTRMIDTPMAGTGGASDIVPAALTVQVMNGNALNTADGIFTMARCNQQLDLGGEGRTWSSFKTQFDSFFKPRLLTGGKLALRGVTCNAYPINMNDFSNFLPVAPPISGDFTWDPSVAPSALSPIVFTQSGTPQNVTFLVTIEWRVRFDPFNPAASSHTFHQSTPDGVWNDIIGAASAAGHGVFDIADEVADIGVDAAAMAGVAAIFA